MQPIVDLQHGRRLLPVAEIFGPTFQGEGPSMGRLAAFLRLGGCNLTCERCDTPYTWDASRYNLRAEISNRAAADIVADLPAAPLLVITGGEPLLYQGRPAMLSLLHQAAAARDVEFETNGTIAPGPDLLRFPSVRFNVSPKLNGPMSVDAEAKRIVPAAIDAFAMLARRGRAVFKFVVDGVAALDQVDALVAAHNLPATAVWIMPQGTSPAPILHTGTAIADAVLERGYNMTTRLHILLWPRTERGR